MSDLPSDEDVIKLATALRAAIEKSTRLETWWDGKPGQPDAAPRVRRSETHCVVAITAAPSGPKFNGQVSSDTWLDLELYFTLGSGPGRWATRRTLLKVRDPKAMAWTELATLPSFTPLPRELEIWAARVPHEGRCGACGEFHRLDEAARFNACAAQRGRTPSAWEDDSWGDYDNEPEV